MSTIPSNVLKNKIDFAFIVTVNKANINGDPLTGNRPRIDIDGKGEITAECIKKKIRQRFQDFGLSVFVQAHDRRSKGDNFLCLRDRANNKWDDKAFEGLSGTEILSQCFDDVRAFGAVCAFKKEKKDINNKEKGRGKNSKEKEIVNDDDTQDLSGADTSNDGKKEISNSTHIRGPVSIRVPTSINEIEIRGVKITKSVNNEGDSEKKGPDTFGMKYYVEYGVYVVYGSINSQMATQTKFTDNDATNLKKALITLFWNDASSARPDGSINVHRLYWWNHKNGDGQYSAAQVHKTLKITPKSDIIRDIEIDVTIELNNFDDLIPEVWNENGVNQDGVKWADL